jgi:heme oxygenase
VQAGAAAQSAAAATLREAGLACAFRLHVRALHTRAERSGIIADILRGNAELGALKLLLRNLLPCYEAMEAALERHSGSALLGGIVRPELFRSASIREDLRTLGGAAALPLLPAGAAYADAVKACAKGDGRRLIAHAYARYLGDLSGGMILQRRLAPLGGALRFHAFPAIADVEAYKVGYRAAIDFCGGMLEDWSAVLDEAAAAFRYNIELSMAVKGVLG